MLSSGAMGLAFFPHPRRRNISGMTTKRSGILRFKGGPLEDIQNEKVETESLVSSTHFENDYCPLADRQLLRGAPASGGIPKQSRNLRILVKFEIASLRSH